MNVTKTGYTIHSPFMSARDAQLLAYGAWRTADMTVKCNSCSCMIMTGDMVRSSAHGHICATCGEE